MPSNFNNLIGQTFGKLTVISRYPTETKTYWNCECSCGGSKIARSDHLKKYNESQQCDICLKTENLNNLIEKAKDLYPDVYDYSKSDYKGVDKNIVVTCNLHGDFLKSPYHLLRGSGCGQCSLADKRQENLKSFIEDSTKIHNGRYDYSKVVYLDYKTKVIVGCPVHGDVEQIPTSHRAGHGCLLCVNKEQVKSVETFIKEASILHNNLYSYDLVSDEIENRHTKVDIVCKIHGIFKQSISNHLQGRGCKACASSVQNFDFIKKYQINKELGQAAATLYLLEMSDNKEYFVKIGITSNRRKRFELYDKEKSLYDYKIVCEVPTTNLGSANLERKIMMEFRRLGYGYKPLKKFTGWTECFSNEAKDLIIKYIEEVNV